MKFNPAEVGRVSQLASLARTLVGEPDLAAMLHLLLEELEAERGVVLLDRGGPSPEPVAWRNPGNDPPAYCPLVVRQALGGQDVLTAEPAEQGVRSILCAPLRGTERVLGMLYVDTRGSFNHATLAFLILVADLAAVALERAERHRRELHEGKLAATDALLAGLSQELNYSLSSILWCAQHLHGELKSPDHGELTTSILNDTLRCQTLVTETLRSCKRQALRPREISLNDCIGPVLHEHEPEFRRQGASLCSEVEEAVDLLGTREHLSQMLDAMLRNAHKAVAGRPGGHVLVRTSRRGEFVRLQVLDNGPGVSDPQRIFDPFYSTGRARAGAGMGLALVRRVVSEHGGSVWVHNAPEGGAVFTVELPVLSGRQAMAA